jgi:hypothetical protein
MTPSRTVFSMALAKLLFASANLKNLCNVYLSTQILMESAVPPKF